MIKDEDKKRYIEVKNKIDKLKDELYFNKKVLHDITEEYYARHNDFMEDEKFEPLYKRIIAMKQLIDFRRGAKDELSKLQNEINGLEDYLDVMEIFE